MKKTYTKPQLVAAGALSKSTALQEGISGPVIT
jgi:hypothetical protein